MTPPSIADPARAAGWNEPAERVGFFTDTSLCIGCKACEVACKEWNDVPDDGLVFLDSSYDNTGTLGANSWRHVAFIEQAAPRAVHDSLLTEALAAVADVGVDGAALASPPAAREGFRWLMSSDVCKHCTHAACLDVCPTGSLFRTEFGTVVVQEDICNGCGYCISACPFGVIDQRKGDGRAWKCTMCYDRLHVGLEPACAQACPTNSIQFGPLDELRDARERVATLHERGIPDARLYGADDDSGVGGLGAFFLLLDEPEVYRLPPDPVVTTRDLPAMWKAAAGAAAMLVGLAAAAAGTAPVSVKDGEARAARRGGGRGRGRGERAMVPPAEFRSYYDRPVLKEPVWKHWIPAYFFAGGLAAGSSLLAEAAVWSGDRAAARRARATALVAIGASAGFLVADLGWQQRFHHMLRVFRPSSPMNMGSWLLAVYAPAAGVAALGEEVGLRGTARVASIVATGLAPAVATYTGVLVADTAVPVWHDAYRELPFLFGAGAAASAGSLGVLIAPRGRVPASALRFALLGAVAEVAAAKKMRKRLGDLVGEVYHVGRAGQIERGARVATASGAALLAPRRTRRLGAALVLAGAALQRFAVAEAGKQSARDPKYVTIPQRGRTS